MLKPDYFTDIDWMWKVSYKFDRFKQVSTSGKTFVCRCPYCGDSKRSKKIARCFFYTKKGSLNFDCKNCGAHGSFWTFMKDQCPNEFNEYKKDQMLKRLGPSQRRSKPINTPGNDNKQIKDKQPTKSDERKSLVGCVSLRDLPDTHKAVKYMIGRCFEREQINRLYYSEDFKVTAQAINPEPLSEKFPSEERIVIPFYDNDGNVEMVQGRSLDPKSSLRYISIKSHEDVDKIYGKEFVDPDETTYCVEGPLDSLFVENCYATCDSALQRSDADVLIFDNEPMNEEIVELMSKAIADKRQLVIWPTSPLEKQDINDMIKTGINKDELMQIIRSRTFSGLRAKLEFTRWKRV